MQGIFESVFDMFYLVLVISFGIKLLFLDEKRAKFFAVMGITLGLGDAFHLIPRIMAHMSSDGMIKFMPLLSWGKFITSLTMTAFYLIYYIYYRKETGKINKLTDIAIILLASLRIILVIMPQNLWGTNDAPLKWKVFRNIPFVLIGCILTYISIKESRFFKKISLLIIISFVCYIPVVLFADTYPKVGMLMIPKTVAYFLIIFFGYRKYQQNFMPNAILITSFISLLFGCAGGVFFREFTKFFGYTGYSMLSILHTHTLILGSVFGLIFHLLFINCPKGNIQNFTTSAKLWLFGLILTVSMMFMRGIYQITGNGAYLFNNRAFSGIAGIGHIVLAVGIIKIMLYFIRCYKSEH